MTSAGVTSPTSAHPLLAQRTIGIDPQELGFCGDSAGEAAPRGEAGEQGWVALEPLCPNFADSSRSLIWAQAPETPLRQGPAVAP